MCLLEKILELSPNLQPTNLAKFHTEVPSIVPQIMDIYGMVKHNSSPQSLMVTAKCMTDGKFHCNNDCPSSVILSCFYLYVKREVVYCRQTLFMILFIIFFERYFQEPIIWHEMRIQSKSNEQTVAMFSIPLLVETHGADKWDNEF